MSSELPVVLLAAGRGERLRPLTGDRPKAMVALGGEPLAARALRTLAGAGLGRVVAVGGYRADRLEALGCELRFNERWAADENVVSLWAARDLVEGGCYVVNSDVLFGPAIAELLAGEPGSFLLSDPERGDEQEAMKARVRDGRLVALSKGAAPGDAAGEYIGLLRIDPADGPRLAAILDEMVAAGRTGVFYEQAVERLAGERPVRVVSVAGLPWAEIDDHEDLARAEREVLALV